MIRVLLVDDEFLVCSFVKQLVDWEAYGYSIIGQAANGRQALMQIEQLKPDMVLLDVNIPEIDGVALACRLGQEHPEICVIMLSSYSDFHYVRETMKYGAADYLLKHELTADSLGKLLEGLRPRFADQDVFGEGAAEERSSFRLLRSNGVRRFFTEPGTKETVPEAFAMLRGAMPVACFLQTTIALPGDLQGARLLQQILSTCTETVNRWHEAWVVYLGERRMVLLFSALPAESEPEQARRVEQAMGIVRDAVLKYHNGVITWHRGARCQDVRALPEMYAQMTREGPATPVEAEAEVRISIEQERRLINAILSGRRGAVAQILDGIFSPLQGKALSHGAAALLSGELLSLTVKLYQEQEIPLRGGDLPGIVELRADALQAFFQGLLLRLVDGVEALSRFTEPVLASMTFVEEHYLEDIGLNEVAAHVAMNASYLGTLFKRETGMGLGTYINRLRIQNAGVLMLMENLPPTQACSQSGFRNYNHFFQIFKETTGLAPKQFKEAAEISWIASFQPLPLEEM